MSKESIIHDEDGNPTHIRETSDDGRESTLYEYDDSISSNIFGNHKGNPVEIADHREDGTTTAYNYDDSIISNITGNHRGEEKGGSGCFLTTACVEFAGLSDNCRELSTLRAFRDNYIAGLSNGRSLIADYYARAPGMVAAIQSRNDRHMIFSRMLMEIRSIVADIERGANAFAMARYFNMVQGLSEFLKKRNL